MREQKVTVDIIIRHKGGIVLIQRKDNGLWALPGGVVEIDETLEQAAVREAREETGLNIQLIGQVHTYSDPSRDTRWHSITTVFVAEAEGKLQAADDAADVMVFDIDKVPKLAFDHNKILLDYHNGEY